MRTTTDTLIITNNDYETLNAYIKGLRFAHAFDRSNVVLLQEELKKARLVKTNELPADVVRLNSTVKIMEGNKGNPIELTLVVPEMADIKQRKISVFAPIGTALIGFRQGKKVRWNVPAGSKTFTIMEVYNHHARI